jgi:hypothetical protein
LIVQRGEVKYINKVGSHKAWKTDEESWHEAEGGGHQRVAFCNAIAMTD